ncbi:MAG: hypothetical protein ACYDC2_12865 [Solirubrobacteraceae bacterium]
MKARLIVLCALALVSAAAFGGVAWARSGKTAKAPIQKENENCGANEPADPTIGTVSFKRRGTTVSVKVLIKKGKPEATDGIWLVGDGCNAVGLFPATLATDSKGVGRVSSSLTVPSGYTHFFASVHYSGGLANDTPYVTLAP